ncbi:hypothetical protein [Anaeroselena agilis]|uniref:Uncharacterized protein n=1 Tax=Anaeroselena agilis TaxID=3063788 RepID=A0ABU3NUY2_9FIRM|nr:hypothetical protein [Selenomonadales bacterium 4137-cl]
MAKMRAAVDDYSVWVYIDEYRWVSFGRLGKAGLYCGCVLSEASCGVFKDEARRVAEQALEGRE